MKTQTRNEPEAYFGQYKCRFSGRQECFKRELSAYAWVWAQTTAGVSGMDLDAEPFIDSTGDVPKERSFTLKVKYRGARSQLWQVVWPGREGRWPLYEAAAKERGLPLVRFDYARAFAISGELVNRKLAQHFLGQAGRQLPGEGERNAVESVLTPQKFLTVAEVASMTGLSEMTSQLACIALWVDGRVKGDSTSCVGPKWRVRRAA